MSLTLPYPDLGPGPVYDAELDANFGAIQAKFGQIDNSDISSGAGIAVSKLSASYQYMQLQFPVATYTSTGAILQYIPLYNDSRGNWTVDRIVWVTDDTGDATAQFSIEWGYLTGASPGTWTSSTTIASGIAITGTANNAAQGSAAGNIAPFDVNQRSFRMNITTQSANSGNLFVALLLRRQITA